MLKRIIKRTISTTDNYWAKQLASGENYKLEYIKTKKDKKCLSLEPIIKYQN